MINKILRNLMVIVATMLMMIVLLATLKFILEIIFKYIEKFALYVTNKFISRLRWKYNLAIFEIFTVLALVFLSINLTEKENNFFVLLNFMLVALLSFITITVRKDGSQYPSILKYIVRRINTKNYIINRIGVLFDSGSSTMVLLIALQITILFLTQLEWPTWVYYLAFLALPIYLNIWIYTPNKFMLDNADILNIRRIVVYILLVIYIVFDCYYKFYSVMYYDASPNFDIESLFVYIGSVFFIALDRVIKAIVEDYNRFKSSIDNKV